MSVSEARTLPTGTVTFLFTDIEGSTTLARSMGEERWAELVRQHDALVRGAVEGTGGVVVRTEGDAFFAAFATPLAAVRAAVAAQRALASHAWPDDARIRVRIGAHTGRGIVVGDDYAGYDVHRAARISAAGHGGQVLVSDATRVLVEDDLPSGVRLRDLGTHRLKDVGPQRLHQLVIEDVAADDRPPRSLEPESNLPEPLTSFVGRERDLELIDELLGSTRLLTLTGPGGTGKTRLALEAARRARDRFEAVYFVDLSPVADAREVVAAIAAAAGVREDPGRQIADVLRDHLGHRQTILVLDNFEQVLDAGRDVTDLLGTDPGLTVLVTSRAPLRVGGEQEYAVQPLALPDPDDLRTADDLAAYEAVALFRQRARAIDPSFSLNDDVARDVARICTRLDGLPLAIELAASRLRSLSPQTILERLDRRLPLLTGGARDRPERQRTLRSAIAWSEELLEPEQATVFARLSVLLGDWSLEDAETVAGADLGDGRDVLDVLEALRDHSLIRPRSDGPGGPWFSMLETIREYALERLASSGDEDATRRRHADRFVALSERAQPQLTGPRGLAWRERIGRAEPNVRSAIEWSLQRGDAATGMRIGAAMWRFWQFRGTLREGIRVMSAILSIPGSEERTPIRARALIAAGSLAYWAGDSEGTRRRYEEALEISRELGDDAGIAHALYNLAYAQGVEGNLDTAWDLLEDALRRFEALGDRLMVAHVKIGLGMAGMRRGDVELAADLVHDALASFEALEESHWIGLAHGVLAQIAFVQGDETRTLVHTKEALESNRRLDDRLGTAVQLKVVGGILARRGLHDRALRLAGAARRISDEAGGEAPRALIEAEDPVVGAAATLSPEQIGALVEEGAQLRADEAAELARRELEELSGA